MRPAQSSGRRYGETQLLVVETQGRGRLIPTKVEHLGDFLKADDLLVVNRSGTLPASFHGKLERTEESIELRLATFRGTNSTDLSDWGAVAFGAGDWRTLTEERGAAPPLKTGDRFQFGPDLHASIRYVDPEFSRLVHVHFESAHLVRELYRVGRPIQYSYLQSPLEVWDQQTLFAGPPLSVEPPSAALPLQWTNILKLQRRGVRLATLVHGAGLSSTGDPALDARFPLDEYFALGEETLDLVMQTKLRGGRIVALGTSVVRALESAFAHPAKPILTGRTTLRLGAESPLAVVDSLITGMHERGTIQPRISS